MTSAHQAKVLYAVLTCAPMTTSKPDFKRYADVGDVKGLWRYYMNAMRARSDVKEQVETGGQISFEMLRPAMETIYGLPTEGTLTDDDIPF